MKISPISIGLETISPPPRASHAVAGAAVAAATLFFAFHLPYLPPSLEDLDSINFALGLRRFDVAEHQPHPPGYPLYIAAGKAVHALVPSEPHALALLGIAAGAAGVLVLVSLFAGIDARPARSGWFPFAAALLTMTAPLYWFTAARPLSDVPGLVAALGVQALTLSATTNTRLIAAGFLSGLATGVRSQIAWLTIPLLVLVLVRRRRGADGRTRYDVRRQTAAPLIGVLVAYLVGTLAWVIPLVVLTGGPLAYWRVLFNQGAEDLSGIVMLWTTPTPRQLVRALSAAFVAPWASALSATVVLAAAAIGVARLYRSARSSLTTLVVTFGPYLVFDLLFQETATTRYALPLVVPIAYLGAAGAAAAPLPVAVAGIAGVAMFDAHVGGTSVAAYARQKAPAFRLLEDMQKNGSTGAAPVLAMDRREALDLRRPVRWAGAGMPPVQQQLPSPPQHEWLELVKYWNDGGRAPVWFVADPLRTDIDLVEHSGGSGNPAAYRWKLPYPVLLGGVRPNEVDWYRIVRPEWYVAGGWALTPESAGVADNDKGGLAQGPIEAKVAHETYGGVMVLGGRNFEATVRPHITATLDNQLLADWVVDPGLFVRFIDLPPAGAGDRRDYAKLTLQASPPSRVGIEQFDVSSTRTILAFGDGWHEQEYNPETGLRWRWLSEHGTLRVRPAQPAASVRLHIEGESPRRYFRRDSRLIVRTGDAVVLDRMLSSDFALDATVPLRGGEGTITLETDQMFIPAERSWRRSLDRRHLGLRIFKCAIIRNSEETLP